jgi:hypothetical protein
MNIHQWQLLSGVVPVACCKRKLFYSKRKSPEGKFLQGFSFRERKNILIVN